MTGLVLVAVLGCAKTPPAEVTTPVVAVPTAQTELGDDTNQFSVFGAASLKQALADGRLMAPASKQGREFLAELAGDVTGIDEAPPVTTSTSAELDESLVVGFPVGLLGESQVFGGVITAVSNKESEDLGRLKLTDLEPVHVRGYVAPSGSDYVFVLVGCARECTEASKLNPIVSIPIIAVDEAGDRLMLDLAPLGKELNLIEMLDPNGEYTKLKTKNSATTAVDYSVSTLVFDVGVTMVPLEAADPAAAPETKFNVRWYLKLGSIFNPAFVSRNAAPGVGFFMTSRSATPRIQRFSQAGNTPRGTVKYFVKNVPTEHQAAYASAFDSWNEVFLAETGKKLLEYEFVAANDPKAKNLVAGDVRYNILEWDLDNRAPYGGLGPSIANQFTGENLSANVLIQGPHILKLYTAWYGISNEVHSLVARGDVQAAMETLAEGRRTIGEMIGTRSATRYSLTLGKNLAFRISSQMPGFDDPAAEKGDFEIVPQGVTFVNYMKGYFHEMVTHELGHNLGLRHNFRGNLSFTGLTSGGVSSSIMEYLGRGFRYLNQIGKYDVMAIQYGYSGKVPTVTNGFCTDEDVAVTEQLATSPECSRDDATADPFGFHESRLDRALAMLVNKGSTEAPLWTAKEITAQVSAAVKGMGFYAAHATQTGTTWTNFFQFPNRPQTVADVPAWVKARVKAKLCDPTLQQEIAAKATPEAKDKVVANLAALRTETAKQLGELQVMTASELTCE